MQSTPRWLGAVVLSALFSVVAVAQAPNLDVRMGLWEMTTATSVGGDMPAIDMSRLSPEQRAQVEATMKGMMGQHTAVTNSCMTKDKMDRANFMTNDTTCKATFATNTRSTLDLTQTCRAGAEQSQMHIEALSPTSIKATFTGTRTEQGKSMKIDGTMTGKWLGGDCGDVK